MELGERPLVGEDIERVVFEGAEVSLAREACERIARAARYVSELASSGAAIYGVTTGFGANRDQLIAPKDAGILQERLIMSHACGLGDPMPAEVVRAMMLLRVNALAAGYSGARIETLDALVAMLNAGIHPIVPEYGSVGSSGDLCPLAHMCLPLIGHGEAEVDGQRLGGGQAMASIGLAPLKLTYKEGIALLNGTQAMTALGWVVAFRFAKLLDMADAIGAMSLEALAGRLAAFDSRIHHLRGRLGQQRVASNVLTLLAGSELADIAPGRLPGKVDFVQDAYSLRCMPQVHGACRDALDHVREVLVVEANAVTDNPLVFPPHDGEPGAILSGGNFHGEPVGMALDYIKIAIAELGAISERRSAKLVDRHHAEGLPAFLVSRPGLNSGMMIPQYVAAALVTENKTRAFPATVDSVPTSANMEDHNSMGQHAGLHAMRMLINAERILGVEYLLAAQALELRGEGYALGAGTSTALALLREQVDFMEVDRVLYPDIERSVALVSSGALYEAIGPWLSPTAG